MACNTHYKKLVTDNQDEILEIVKNTIFNSEDSFLYDWYDFKSISELFDNTDEAIQEIANYVYENTEGLIKIDNLFYIYESAGWDFDIGLPKLKGCSDYIVKSADEMFKVMKNGLYDEEGNLCNFYYPNDPKLPLVRKHIIDFFNTYPNGIITFR